MELLIVYERREEVENAVLRIDHLAGRAAGLRAVTSCMSVALPARWSGKRPERQRYGGA
jgi:hypothetical protein